MENHFSKVPTTMKFSVIFVLMCQVLTLSSGFELTVLHVNDIHVRIEETNKYSGNCKAEDKEAGHCFGGLARLHTAVKEVKAKEPNTIFLNGGDFYQGNAYYTHFKWRIVAPFANILNFTAMAPGNHEFDDNVNGFVPFLKNTQFPVIAANLDTSLEASLEGNAHFFLKAQNRLGFLWTVTSSILLGLMTPSVVVERGGRKIGIIGYVTTDTPELSNSGQVRFIDEVVAIDQEAKRLKAQGVEILVALGHSGYEKDQEIAKQVPDIDLVVGGHTHSFLYTGPEPSTEKPSGPYPTIVMQDNGRKVPVIQAYAYTKYLGHFKVNFDDEGEVTTWTGSPMLLDNRFAQDEDVLKELVPWKDEVKELELQVFAQTKVVLLARRGEETNLGNLVTDSMVDHYAQNGNTDNDHWTYVPMAFLNSGGLRGSFEIGNISAADILAVLPFENTVDVITLKGRDLKSVFEEMAKRMNPDGTSGNGGFLQVSGIFVTFDLRRQEGDRVIQLKTRCSKCRVPKYQPVDLNQEYNVTTVSYLANGGDGYHIIKDKKLHHITGALDSGVFQNYVARIQPLISSVENRITILTKDTQDYLFSSSSSPFLSSTMVLSICCLIYLF
ncbi:hypothetical protein TCAL_04631 [Tigriopus californicus]|uniref:5'-nucleotidase n=1 Tax=Tigriopus californicus TaxID=6832 RepID=A0A553NFH5_TIGCA|nr:hypothetical protein TCAL_04631 [Tigriopus californicus]|eukprot:TCALIF_04631-PC protein Name:"Similar to Nt5e 5'-nucleotidase (Mus musculus)" AED:0.24 eAED:0.24 QI:13/1/0.9/1/0.77/0.8/10/768/609